MKSIIGIWRPLIILVFTNTLLIPRTYAKGTVEYGVGTEYGLVGMQLILPIKTREFEPYLTLSLVNAIGRDNKSNIWEGFVSGVGINYKLSRSSFAGIYGGVLDKESYFEPYSGTITEYDYGISVNYKHNLSFISDDLYIGISQSFGRRKLTSFMFGYRYKF